MSSTPPDSGELVKRLRAYSYRRGADAPPFHVHPAICDEAAAFIQSSSAEIEGLRAALKELPEQIYRHIEHGDEKHRAWLREELDKFFALAPPTTKRLGKEE